MRNHRDGASVWDNTMRCCPGYRGQRGIIATSYTQIPSVWFALLPPVEKKPPARAFGWEIFLVLLLVRSGTFGVGQGT
jgi:hypothetical protein